MKHDVRNPELTASPRPASSPEPGKRSLAEARPTVAPAAGSSPQRPLPGKQSLVELFADRPHGPKDWGDLRTMFGTPGQSGAPRAGQTGAGRSGPVNPRTTIQRKENPGDSPPAASGPCLDPEAISAELERITTAALATLDLGQLQQLSLQTEDLEHAIDTCGPVDSHRDLAAQLKLAQDTLVARFQALAVQHADQTLRAWDAAPPDQRDQQRAQYQSESGWPNTTKVDQNWCGMFVNAQFRAAGFAPAFNMAFDDAGSVAEFFEYHVTSRSPGTIKPHGTGAAVPLRGYHHDRGSERTWHAGAAIGNDIRAGDVVTLNLDGDANPEHICIVASYTAGSGAQPGTLVTIDGNAYGARTPTSAPPGSDVAPESMTTLSGDVAKTDVSTSTYQRTGDAAHPDFDRSAMIPKGVQAFRTMTLVGRGRPSLVDFEPDHQYPGFTGDTDGPGDKLQLKGGPGPKIQRKDGPGALAADPAAAFAAATQGGPGEIPHRAEMQQRFGADFSSVQAYTGRDLGGLRAHAATRGEQVAFASATPDRETVAHELTHVIQSRNGSAGAAAVSDPGDASEHEARRVEQSVAVGEPIAPQAAPSAAIHRQGTDPTAVQPGRGGNRQDTTIDWDSTHYFISDKYKLPGSNSAPGSIREVYEFFLLRQLQAELPDLVAEYVAAGGIIPPETEGSLRGKRADGSQGDGRKDRHAAVEGLEQLIQGRMQSLATSDPASADRIRVRLFAANEQALANAMLIPGSSRYTPVNNKDGGTDTWCNIYAYDMVTAMGGYLPRVWWTKQAIAKFQAGQQPSPSETEQQTANALYDWMTTWGTQDFGWYSVPGAKEAQTEADAGRLVIILASTGPVKNGAGHVSVVMAQTPREREHPRLDQTNNQFVPLQSQAGAENFASNAANLSAADVGETGRTDWWDQHKFHADHSDPEHDAGSGFFVYDASRKPSGSGALSVRPPEEMGTVMPQAGSGAGNPGPQSGGPQ